MAYWSALTPFFTGVLLPCFWPHRTALPLPECGGVMRGRAVEDGPSLPMLLSYISGQQDVFFFIHSRQFYPCDNGNKWPPWYHREVLNLSFIAITKDVNRFPWSHVNLVFLSVFSSCTPGSVWDPLSKVLQNCFCHETYQILWALPMPPPTAVSQHRTFNSTKPWSNSSPWKHWENTFWFQ